MARMTDLSRKRDRDRLAVRREAYWQRLDAGAYLGFRRGPNTWLARFRGRDGRQQWQPLGEALEYDEAKRRAEDWLSQLEGSPVRSVKRDSVIAALDTYLEDLRRNGRPDAAKAAEGRFRTALRFNRKAKSYEDPLAHQRLETTTREDFLELRGRLCKGRLPRTVNRLMRAICAGLNKANRCGHLGTPAAWRIESISDDGENETAVFLAPEQRQALRAVASADAAAFLYALELSGGRPKEIAGAVVRDFDGDRLKLSHKKGRPPKLRSRYVILDDEGMKFFKAQAEGKTPTDLLLTRDGKPWRRHQWAEEVRKAIAASNLITNGKDPIPTEASAYSFRHARISELLQIYGVDPLTVAAQTGTSLQMIERTYFKFIQSALREKLNRSRDTASALSSAA